MPQIRYPDTLVELLHWAAARHGTRGVRYTYPATGGDRFVSYSELFRQAARLLSGLRAEGIAPGMRVMIHVEENELALPLFWACLLGGFVPMLTTTIESYDTPSPALARLQHVTKLLDTPWILTRTSHVERVATLGPARVLAVETLRVENEALHLYSPLPQEIAFLSMATDRDGRPHCAILTHRSVLANARAMNRLGNGSDSDVVFTWGPLADITGIAEGHIRPMILGGDAIFAPHAIIAASPMRWMDLMHRYGATHCTAPDSAYRALTTATRATKRQHWDLSSLRILTNTGEPVTEETVSEMEALLTRYGAGKGVLRSSLCLTELSGAVSGAAGISFVDCEGRRVAELGLAAPGVSARVGNGGALEIRGDMCFGGYLNEGKATAQKFGADGWLRTGYVGLVSDGKIVVTGREEAVLVVKGTKVFATDIEKCAPGIVAALAVDGDKLAVFCLAEEGVREAIAKATGLTPDYVVTLAQGAVPREAFGAIDHQALLSLAKTASSDVSATPHASVSNR